MPSGISSIALGPPRSVFTQPGSTAYILTFVSFKWSANAQVSWFTAVFEIEYEMCGPILGTESWARPEEKLIILASADFFRRGKNFDIIQSVPRRLMFIIFSKSFRFMVSIFVSSGSEFMPALFTRTSITGCFFDMSVKALFMLPIFSTSHSTNSTLSPFAFKAATDLEPLFLSLQAIITRAPNDANFSDIANPMPRVAPVTITVLPFKSI